MEGRIYSVRFDTGGYFLAFYTTNTNRFRLISLFILLAHSLFHGMSVVFNDIHISPSVWECAEIRNLNLILAPQLTPSPRFRNDVSVDMATFGNCGLRTHFGNNCPKTQSLLESIVRSVVLSRFRSIRPMFGEILPKSYWKRLL